MKISTEELEANGYRLVDKLEFDELMPFLMPYLKKWNLATAGFVLSSFLCVLGSVIIFWAWYWPTRLFRCTNICTPLHIKRLAPKK